MANAQFCVVEHRDEDAAAGVPGTWGSIKHTRAADKHANARTFSTFVCATNSSHTGLDVVVDAQRCRSLWAANAHNQRLRRHNAHAHA